MPIWALSSIILKFAAWVSWIINDVQAFCAMKKIYEKYNIPVPAAQLYTEHRSPYKSCEQYVRTTLWSARYCGHKNAGLRWDYRRCYTLQFGQQLATQHWKMFLLQLPRWGVAPCNAIWATCNDLYRESLAIFATGAPESVGFTKTNQRTLGENCVASCWRGVTLCNGSCKLLRLLRKVELDSTSCNVARNKKRCVASCRGTLLHRAILQQLATQRCCVASCCKNCAV